MSTFIRPCNLTSRPCLLLIALLIFPPAFTSRAYGFIRVEDKTVTTVPFDGTNDLIVVNVLLNGKGPFRLILDTGASGHAISTEVATALGLKIEGEGVIDVGSKKTAGAGVARIAKMEIGEFGLLDQTFFIAPFPSSYPFQGFLGAEVFKRFVVRVDFERSMLTLTSLKNFRYQGGGTIVPLKLYKQSIPQLRCDVDGQKGWLKLDTGYNGTLALFGRFIEEHRLLKKYAPVMREEGGQTLAGKVGESPVARVSVLRLGQVELRDITTTFFLEKGNSNDAFSGAIGTGILKRFNVILNYHDQKIIFERR